jgi:hypothetical protein
VSEDERRHPARDSNRHHVLRRLRQLPLRRALHVAVPLLVQLAKRHVRACSPRRCRPLLLPHFLPLFCFALFCFALLCFVVFCFAAAAGLFSLSADVVPATQKTLFSCCALQVSSFAPFSPLPQPRVDMTLPPLSPCLLSSSAFVVPRPNVNAALLQALTSRATAVPA